MSTSKPRFLDDLQQFSIPLSAGVIAALTWAKLDPASYEHRIHGQPLTLHFLIDDLFMVFCFGIATQEITESCLPGGALDPLEQKQAA